MSFSGANLININPISLDALNLYLATKTFTEKTCSLP